MKASSRSEALIILDMLNLFNFPEAGDLIGPALEAAKQIEKLKVRFKKRGLPIIYVNDNFGQWKADWKMLYNACANEKCLGSEIARLLKPDEDDFFILKPKHSGFFQTPLDLLLEDLKIEKLVLTGIAGNLCVLFTAHDAHMRNYEVVVPKDCMASNTRQDHEFTLRQLDAVLGIATTASQSL